MRQTISAKVIMPIAQSSFEQTGIWMAVGVGSLSGVLLVVWLARQIWVSFTAHGNGNQLVTENDLRRRLRGLKANLTSRIEGIRSDLIERMESAARSVEKLDKYTHDSVHEIKNAIQPVLTQTAILNETQKKLDAAVAEVSRESKQQSVLLTEISTLLKSNRLTAKEDS